MQFNPNTVLAVEKWFALLGYVYCPVTDIWFVPASKLPSYQKQLVTRNKHFLLEYVEV
jgi:hypothetical protein